MQSISQRLLTAAAGYDPQLLAVARELQDAWSNATTAVAAPDFAKGCSRKVDDRRREALREWLPMLLERISRAGERRGLSVQQASRDTAAVPGF